MADLKRIEPAHPLFRLVFGSTFNEGEKWALGIYLDRGCPKDHWQDALEASVLNSWESITWKIIRSSSARVDLDTLLTNAARVGNIVLMREARKLGATFFDWALENAAAGGHIAAMRVARDMGAQDFSRGLEAAASYSLAAVEEAIAMGATITDEALCNAAENGHVDIMRDLCSVAISRGVDLDFNQAFYCAAGEGHIEAMRLARAMGRATEQPPDFDAALADAARNGHLEVVKEALALGATGIAAALAAARSASFDGRPSREVIEFLQARL